MVTTWPISVVFDSRFSLTRNLGLTAGLLALAITTATATSVKATVRETIVLDQLNDSKVV